jgi:crossover junction endodeoxyribonuclease RuvC
MPIILWIDPGTTTTGYAIIQKHSNSNFELVDFGVFTTTPKIDLAIKLLEIWKDIQNLISTFNPTTISIEKLFFQNNIKTWIDVAQARGVVMYEAIKNDLKILEYTPLQVKKAITWNGQAKKAQLQRAIAIIMRLEEIPKPDDAADAIWLAYMWALNSNNLNWVY